ncbi:MAG: hypothetical protein AB4040_03685 [Synechococcus sp.]
MPTKNQEKRLVNFKQFAVIIIFLGSAVRVIQYCFNRSLWADESVLALNIIHRSYRELLQPLDYDQGAPFGFLMLEKFATQVLGANEYALRLFPLIGGITTLVIFYYIARQYLTNDVILMALVLVGFSDSFVYFSTEVKQYSTDVTIALLCFWIAKQLQYRFSTSNRIILLVAGFSLVWFSHPAIFVLVGVTCSLIVTDWNQTRPLFTSKSRINSVWISLKNLLGVVQRQMLTRQNFIIYASWLVSFLLFYLLSVLNLSSNETLQNSWQSKGAYPDSYNPIDILLWLVERVGLFFYTPLGYANPGNEVIGYGVAIALLRLFAFIMGSFSFAKRKSGELLILLSPILITLFAAFLRKYPFEGRLVFFLSPFIMILIAEGMYRLCKIHNLPLKGIGFVVSILILSQPLQNTLPLFHRPFHREEIKPVLEYVKQHQEPEDILYVYQRGIRQFEFYAKTYGYEAGDYSLGVDDLDEVDGRSVSEEERVRYYKDLDRLRGNPRVWVLFSHAWIDEENDLVTNYLNCMGEQIDSFREVGAFVYLYDLSHTSSECQNSFQSRYKRQLASVGNSISIRAGP